MGQVSILLLDDGTTKVALAGDQPSAGADVTVSALSTTVGAGESLDLKASVVVPFGLLAAVGTAAGVFRFVAGSGPKSFHADLTLPTGKTFFGKSFDANTTATFSVTLTIPGAGAPTAPFAEIGCVLAVSAAVGSAAVGLKVVIDDVPAAFPVTSPPALEIAPPGLLGLTPVRIPWAFPKLADFPIQIPALAFPATSLPVRVGWKSIALDFQVGGGTSAVLTVTIVQLSLTATQGVGTIQADVKATFDAGGGAPVVAITNVSASGRSLPDLKGVTYLGPPSGCSILAWAGSPAGPLLGLLSPELADSQDSSANQFVLRIPGPAGPPPGEVRLDWSGPSVTTARTLNLPGFDVDLPQLQMASLIGYRTTSGGKRRLALALTIPTGQTVTASSTFTWASMSGGDDPARERHSPANGAPADPPLIQVSATTKKAVSLVVADLPIDRNGPPQFFKQLATALTTLSTTPPAPGGPDPCAASPMTIGSLTADAWGTPTLNLSPALTKLFQFPFLNQGNDPNSATSQFIAIKGFDPPVPDPSPPSGGVALTFSVGVNLHIQLGGAIEFDAKATLVFDLEHFAFRVDHSVGISIAFDKADAKIGEFLGLTWKFTPGPAATGTTGVFPAFVLVTAGGNYQLKQAPGSILTISFDRLTSPDEPIVFAVSNFALTPSGIELDATITKKPARLNGLETKFSFTDGTFQIRSNKITDFSIKGSGPLPEALVGNATADIGLQFGQRDGSLKLLSGSAELHASKHLRCDATRFEFEIDALGLRFVDDGGYHLYFTLSGSAQFAPLATDDSSGPLAWLPKIKIQLTDCPLTGNMAVIAKHVKFLVELPKKVSFSLLGCFEMELRGISFLASTEGIFDDNAAALLISGQVKFAEGGGDVLDVRVDFHNLYIGLPEKGKTFPRLHLKGLDIKVNAGDAFALEGAVDFLDNDLIATGLKASGFEGKGSVTIVGLPTLSATFAFLRVTPDDGATWLRAWFIYLEVDRISIQIPVVEIFIREVGLGFGYRFTLASIQAADQINDPKQLIKTLTQLSLTQGNLSDVSSWKVDVEGKGESARWTVALRAMISQTSASAGVTDYNQDEEADLACLFLLDAVLALRSDLTFFMVARAWIDTNYNDFVTDTPSGLRNSPLFSAFILLSVRKKLFLAHMASNRNALFGDHPPLPDFLKKAITGARFSATLLVQPGLFHAELGWPNMLEWQGTFGPLSVDFRGGAIFRVSTTEIVNGLSFLAKGTLQLSAGVDLGFVGASLEATASVAYGARYIGVLAFVDPFNNSAFYAAIGLEINVSVSVSFWIKIELLFAKIELDFSFSFSVNFTASLELGITFRSTVPVGVRGSATIGLSIMGHDLHFGVRIGLNEGAVNAALAITNPFLNVGLEASDGASDAIPGTPGAIPAAPAAQSAPVAFHGLKSVPHAMTRHAIAARLGHPPAVPAVATPAPTIVAPPYHINTSTSSTVAGVNTVYLLLIPAGQVVDAGGDFVTQNGFYAVPPDKGIAVVKDYAWTIPAPPTGQSATLTHYKFDPDPKKSGTWEPVTPGAAPFAWKSNWAFAVGASIFDPTVYDPTKPSTSAANPPQSQSTQDLRTFLRHAYVTKEDQTPPAVTTLDVTPVGDPVLPEIGGSLADARVQNPDESAYEAAVRGAMSQVVPPPYLRRDPDSPYEQNLTNACSNESSIYNPSGRNDTSDTRSMGVQRAKQLRGAVLQAVIRDFQSYATLARYPGTNADAMRKLEAQSLAFQLGMVFKAEGFDPTPGQWLIADASGTIIQRATITSTAPDSPTPQSVAAFNFPELGFATTPPEFTRIKQFAHANSVAFDWALAPATPPADSPAAKFTKGDPRLDPEHLLRAYKIHRIRLDGNEAPADFNVKKADVLHLPIPETGQTIPPVRLLSRFQFVDHFANETAGDADALTDAGKTYLYTITPVDVSGQESTRPLSLVVTRMPAEPPQVPTDGEFLVVYGVDSIPDPGAVPILREPAGIAFRWTTPAEPTNATPVGIRGYQLVFRREATVPIGFFGGDGQTQGPVSAGLPTSNARPLRTDMIVPLDTHTTPPLVLTDPSTGRPVNAFVLPVSMLEQKGIIAPAISGTGRPWRPEAWRVFAQSESVAGVLSAMAPVGMVIRFLPAGAPGLPTPGAAGDPSKAIDWHGQPTYEERRPALLEWVPGPVGLAPLPPRDIAGDPGFLLVPMPARSSSTVGLLQPAAAGKIAGLAFADSPDGRRAVRFHWNQGPSQDPDHPIDLHARYQLFEFDADAHRGDSLDVTSKTISFTTWSGDAGLRLVQETELLPGDQLPLSPSDINAPITWEAWYPSTTRRQMVRDAMIAAGTWPKTSQSPYSPWYSWRDSAIVWPDPDQGAGLSVPFVSDTAAPVADPTTLTLEFVYVPNPGAARVLVPINLATATNNLTGVVAAINALGLPLTASRVPVTILGTARFLLSVKANAGANPPSSFELRTKLGDPSTSLLTREMLVTVTVPAGAVQVARRTRPCHPFLQRVIGLLGRPVGTSPAPTVELNPPPPRLDHDQNLTNLLRGTDAQSDPYGWGILRRFGLSVAVRLRNPDGTYVEADDLFSRVGNAAAQALGEIDPAKTLAPCVHVEHLVQAGRRYRLGRNANGPATEQPDYGDLLALVTISLRPTILQRYTYQRYVIPRPAPDPTKGTAPVAAVTIKVGAAVGASYQVRSGDQAGVEVPLAAGPDVVLNLPFPPTGSGGGEPSKSGDAIVLLFRALDFSGLTVTAAAPAIATLSTFGPTDWDATYFETPDPKDLTAATDIADLFWGRLARYLQGLRPLNAPNAASDVGIPNPTTTPDVLPGLLSWLSRFFDHGGDVSGAPGKTAAGPFLASAYPRSATPVAVTPDAANRIETYEPINDLWAHVYRYYVKPIGRYDPLWVSLAGSLVLFPDVNGHNPRPASLERLQTIPSPEPGGLDVVFDRLRPLAPPLVLASRRLDSPVAPGAVAAPGTVWEVLVAKHPEQTLVERNRSLADHLSYRQTAFTLLRQFSYGDAQTTLSTIVASTYSPLYDAADSPVAPVASPTLELAVGTATKALNLAGNNNVAGVVAAINAAGLGVTAVAAGPTGARLRVDLTPPVSAAELRATPGVASSDLLFHPSSGGGPEYGAVVLDPNAPFFPTAPTTAELAVTSTARLDLSGKNTVAGAVTAINAATLGVTAAEEPRGFAFTITPTIASDPVQLRTTPGSASSDILSHPAGQPARSPRFDADDSPVVSGAPPVLELLVGTATKALNLTGKNTVAGVVAAVNASGLPVAAVALAADASRLRVAVTGAVNAAQVRKVPGDPATDLLIHATPSGPPFSPEVPTGEAFATATPPVVELAATTPKSFPISAGGNTIAGVAPVITGLAMGVKARPDSYGLQFTVVPTAAGTDVQLRTTAGDPTTDILSRVFSLPLAAPVTTTMPGLPAAPDVPDVLSPADLLDPDPAASANLPARVARFGQGLVALQFEALPFFYRHRLLLVAQAAAVVSPVTELQQADFHFVSPPPIAEMEAVPSAGDLPRRRRILISLARFWDGLDADARRRWAVEDPETSAGTQRFFGMMPDPEVAYELVVAQPSGLAESLAQIRSRSSALATATATHSATGYDVFQVPKTFLTTAVRILPPADLDDAGRQTMQLELLLNRLAGIDDDSADTAQPVSSRLAFAATTANSRLTFPAPTSLSLRVVASHSAPLTPGDIAELKSLGSSSVSRDQSFMTAVGVLTAAIAAGIDTPESAASVGLEALGEIATAFAFTPPTETNRKIVWSGLLTQAQRDTIAAWADVSSFRQTFQALLKQADAAVVTLTYSAAVAKPTNADLPAALRPALSVTTTGLTWTGLLVTDTQNTALLQLAGDMTLPQPFRDAVGLLLKESTTATAATTITVDVVESDWHPRPTAADLSASLAGKLLIGVGRIAFRGLMTRAEGLALQGAPKLSAPDADSVNRLFAATLSAGLGGGTLALRTRRGGAPTALAAVSAVL